METTTLGRTGLRVSVAGLGCGGHSRLGQSYGLSEEASADVVRRALDLGITLVDTAEVYGTERIVGEGLSGRRHEVVVSTKARWTSTPDELLASLEGSLERLGTDYVDIYFLHGVAPDGYQEAEERLVPVLRRAQEAGKVRFIGVTEFFNADPQHRMLSRALRDDHWDVVMVGFNVLNQSARERVFPLTRAKGVGTLNMFAVRRALRTIDEAAELVGERAGVLREALDESTTLTDVAYRFCRHEPGVDVVLTGTGNVSHLERNVRSLLGPPLHSSTVDRLHDVLGGADSLTGN